MEYKSTGSEQENGRSEQRAPYRKFSSYLKSRYGCKVYKLPVNLPGTCPNRDGHAGTGGCCFCGEEGAGFEMLSSSLSVQNQIRENAHYIGKNYNPDRFIAYFQNYSNTYLPLELFAQYMREACMEQVAALYISTRPDCIDESRLDILSRIREEAGVDIVLELGLQSVNGRSLRWLNRGHGTAEFVDAVLRSKKRGLEVCAHMILDLPTDEPEDAMDGAKLLSALEVEQVKCHSLYVLENTVLGERYRKGEFMPVSMETFIDRTILFLEFLHPQIVVQRLLGRAPAERTLFCNWNTSWWKIQESIESRMLAEGRVQGRCCDYLNGAVVRKAFG